MIEVAVLGPVRLLVDREPVGLASVQQRILVACLALEPGRPVSVPRLIAALWPGDVPANSQGNLHSYVSRLRRVVGADRLVHEPGGYRLVVEPTDVDVGAARALVAQAHALLPGDPAGAGELLDGALGLWRGEPLADLPDRLAFAPDLADLDAWHRQLTEDRAAFRLAAGEAVAAIPDLERMLAADPLRERGVELLMRALHAGGRTADALALARAYRLRLVKETGLDPGPDLPALEQGILTDDPALRIRSQRPVVPSVARSRPPVRPPEDLFVGRVEDLRQLRDALADHRLVTVVGPGGVGKTRLVVELLSSAGDPGGGAPEAAACAFVELASVTGPDEVAAATAARLGLTAAPAGTIDALVDRLCGEACLLVLDNCEHVRGSAARLVRTLLARCPELRVLATSRRRLEVSGERLVRLAPLSTEAQIELFYERATRLRPGFESSAQARRLVAQICGHLDGLPLAVELAAQREAVFGLRQLHDRMAAGLSILDPIGSGEDVGGIAATAEWSYRLLDGSSRALFDRLAICAGGFSVEALVHFAPEERAADALLAELVDASMVLADHGPDPPRYRILEPIRQLGERHLDQPAHEAAEAAHTAWMRRHVAAARRAQDDRSPAAGRLLQQERANLRQALRRSVEGAAWTEAASLGIETALLVVDNPLLDLLDPLVQLARVTGDDTDVDDRTRALCLAAAGTAWWLSGHAESGVRRCSEAVDLLPDAWAPVSLRCMGRLLLGDVEGVEEDARRVLEHAAAPAWLRATAACSATLIHEFLGDHAAATAWAVRHASLLERVAAVDGFVDYTRGELMMAEEPERALRAFERAEARCRAAGLEYNRMVAQVGRASVLVRLDQEGAVPACAEALTDLREAGMWPQVWMMLRLVAEFLAPRGAPGLALALLDAADQDPLAPPVLDAEGDRLARLRNHAAEAAGGGPLDVAVSGRVEGVRLALDALTGRM